MIPTGFPWFRISPGGHECPPYVVETRIGGGRVDIYVHRVAIPAATFVY